MPVVAEADRLRQSIVSNPQGEVPRKALAKPDSDALEDPAALADA